MATKSGLDAEQYRKFLVEAVKAVGNTDLISDFSISIDGVTDIEVTYIDRVIGPVEPKELTLAQIEFMLGYKIKIVNNKENK